MNPTPDKISDLARKAVEAEKRAESPLAAQFDHGLPHSSVDDYFQALNDFQTVVTPAAWLSLSTRLEACEAALKEARGKALEEAAKVAEKCMLSYAVEGTIRQELKQIAICRLGIATAIRALSPPGATS